MSYIYIIYYWHLRALWPLTHSLSLLTLFHYPQLKRPQQTQTFAQTNVHSPTHDPVDTAEKYVTHSNPSHIHTHTHKNLQPGTGKEKILLRYVQTIERETKIIGTRALSSMWEFSSWCVSVSKTTMLGTTSSYDTEKRKHRDTIRQSLLVKSSTLSEQHTIFSSHHTTFWSGRISIRCLEKIKGSVSIFVRLIIDIDSSNSSRGHGTVTNHSKVLRRVETFSWSRLYQEIRTCP